MRTLCELIFQYTVVSFLPSFVEEKALEKYLAWVYNSSLYKI